MSNLFVSTRSQGSTPLGVPVTLKGTVSDAPKGLERFLSGDFLRGTVLGQDDQNRLLVRTDLGVLKIITKTPLPPGTEVTLELRQAGARIQVLILQAIPNDGTGTAETPKEAPLARAPGNTGQRLLLPDSIIQGQTIKAIIQAPSQAGISSALPELSGRLLSGTELSVRVLSIGLPPRTPVIAESHQPAKAAEPGSPTLGSNAAASGGNSGRTQTLSPANPAAPSPTVPSPAVPSPTVPSQAVPSPAVPSPAVPSQAASNPAPPSQKPLSHGQTNPLPLASNPPALAQTTPPPTKRIAIPPSQNAPNPSISAEPLSIDRLSKPVASSQPIARQSVTDSRIGITDSRIGSADSRIASREIVNLLRGIGGKANLPRVHKLLATSAPVQPAYSYDEPDLTGVAIRQLKAISPSIEGSKGEFNLRITGQVTGTSGTGQPIMRTALGILTLDLSSPIPRGSSVALEISGASLNALPTPATQTNNLEAAALQNEAASFLQLDGMKLPLAEIGRNLGPSLLLFLAVLKGGRVAEWLSGEPIPTPAGAKLGASEPLFGPESAQFVRSVENSSGDWRLIYLPFLHMGTKDHLRLFLRQKKSAASQTDENDKTRRFVVEANLPNWNNLQLDGFVTPERFDLIFRSDRPLTAEQQGHISAIFEQTLKFEDWQGQISFLELAGKFMGGEFEDVGEVLV